MNGSNLYATVMNYPEDGEVNIKSLALSSPDFHGIIKDVEVLGFNEKPDFKRTEESLTINTKNIASDHPVVFKIEID